MVSVNKNSTFLPVDSILYPKVSKRAVEVVSKQSKRKETIQQPELDGLKGYSAAGK